MSSSRPPIRPRRPSRRRRRLRLASFVPAGVVAAALVAGACTPATGTTERVSVPANGSQLSGTSFAARITGDGRFVAFSSELPDRTTQVFRKNRTTGALKLVSIDEVGEQFRGRSIAFDVSADGSKVAFTNTVPDENGLNLIETAYVRDLKAGTTTPVAVDRTGRTNSSRDPDLSTDGRYVAFSSTGHDLVVGDTNNDRDVFVRDLAATGVSISRTSLSFGGNQIPDGGDLPRISADGRFVLFRTTANLVGEDTDDNEDIYVRDTLDKITTFESLAGTRTFARDADISGDGRLVVFNGESGPTVQAQTFVRDRGTNELTVISHKAGSTAESNNLSFDVDISNDGRHVAFSSVSSDLVPGDTVGQLDVFVSSSSGGKVTRVSLRPNGQEPRRASIGGEVADGGKVIVFQSEDAELVSGDTNGATDIFVHRLP